jgi:beta-glucosidase
MVTVKDNTVYGKVSYFLDADGNDSVNVSVAIYPEGLTDPVGIGFESLKLKTEGDVGLIHTRGKKQEMIIWFTTSGGVINLKKKYVAAVTADVQKSFAMDKADKMVEVASHEDMAYMMAGHPTDFGGVGNSYFETPGIKTSEGELMTIKTQYGSHGYSAGNRDSATAFPTCGGVACTWDPDMAFKVGQGIGDEFRSFDRNVCLGPAMNTVWHPRLGRGFEYYSEDSYLAGKMAAAQEKGLLSKGVIGSIKHFACNNIETDRLNVNSEVDERSLRELFLPQFKECVVKGGALSIMTAYNAVNGHFSAGNKYLLYDVLREDWGFKGYAMSDWDVRITDGDDDACIKYGVDVRVPEPLGLHEVNSIVKWDKKYAQFHARNIIYANAKVGLMSPGYTRKWADNMRYNDAHAKLVRDVGARSLVLAKNDGNVLPIPTGVKICLTGPKIDKCRTGGDPNDWGSMPLRRYTSPLKGITEVAKQKGVTIVDDMNAADYIVVAVGVHGEGEGLDRSNVQVQDDSKVKEAMAINPKKTIVLYTGGTASVPGEWSKAPSILVCFGPGQEQGYSIADVLFGTVNPGGKLNATFPGTEGELQNFNSVSTKLIYPPAWEAHGYYRVNALGKEPLFAFGHGLSYTTFEYSNLEIFPTTIKKGNRVSVSVDVKNTGNVDGDEVVQLYLSLPSGGTVKVRKQDLRGFDRITLAKGETKKVNFTIEPDGMAYWKVVGTELDGDDYWDILPGTYGVRVGTSSKITPKPDQPSVSSSFTVNE